MNEKSAVFMLLILLSGAVMVGIVAPVMQVNASISGLIYNSSYNVHSADKVQTMSTSLVDDPKASSTFTILKTQIILIIYQACNQRGKSLETESIYGKQIGVNVDGSDVATTQTSPREDAEANGGVVIWVGTLGAGSHTVKGRFASNKLTSSNPINRPYETTVTIHERRLTVVVFDGTADDFRFVRSTNVVTANSLSLVDDIEASFSFTSPICKTLILYVACNYNYTTEGSQGKRIAISTDGTDGLALGSAPFSADYADDEFVAEIRSLPAGSHTIKGRFASNEDSKTVTVSERQFAVLFFPDGLETDFVEQFKQESFTSYALTNDPDALVTRTTNGKRQVLAIYCTGKRMGTGDWGRKEAVNIDGVDYGLNAQSGFEHTPSGNLEDQHAATMGIQSNVTELSAGAHTVQGRLASYSPGIIDDRQLCVLWFSIPVVGGVVLPSTWLQVQIVLLLSAVAVVLVLGMKKARARPAYLLASKM